MKVLYNDSMKTNLGSPGDGDFFGREKLISRIQDDLQTTSIRLEDVRRVGKTWLMKHLARHCPPEMHLVYMDVEGVATPVEFVERVYGQLSKDLPKSRQIAKSVNDLLNKVKGTQVAGVKIPDIPPLDWQTHFEALLTGYAKCFEPGIVVFAFDELPWAIDAIADRSYPDAEKLLGLLRSMRSRHPQIRMIYCGSIGFHHVIRRLMANGLTADPLVDMKSLSVGPLGEVEAVQLAEALLFGEGIYAASGQAVATKIAAGAGGFPFYIQHVVSHLSLGPQFDAGCTEADADRAFTAILDAPEQNFRFGAYEERLIAHHGDQMARACRRILDVLAISDAPVGIPDLESMLSLDPEFQESAFRATGANRFSRNDFVDALRLLIEDRYLVKDSESRISFSFELFRQAWRRMRFLL